MARESVTQPQPYARRYVCHIENVSPSQVADWQQNRKTARRACKACFRRRRGGATRRLFSVCSDPGPTRCYQPEAARYGRRGQRLEHTIAPNILNRAFVASSANQKWVADYTHIWTGEGWLYVAVVIDLYSRRAVGWSINSQMMAQLVTDALLIAIWRRGSPQASMHHWDQSSQSTSEQFQRLLTDHGVICSMSKRGVC